MLPAEIVEDLEAALAEFAQISEAVGAVGQTEEA
jgi:hypothetical protein